MRVSTPAVHLVGLGCFLLATLLYLRTLNGALLFDDVVAIGSNDDLRPHSSWSNLLWHDFWGYDIMDNTSHKSYRPLCSATLKMNFHLHELEPLGYHLVNVVINSLVCYLYSLVCGCVFERQLWPTLVSSVLFTVHPIHTEVVSGAVGRAELMCAGFFLSALLAYQRMIKNGGWWRGVGVCALCLCSFLSKEHGIMAAAACLAYEVLVTHQINLKSIGSISKRVKVPNQYRRLMWRVFLFTLFSFSLLAARLVLMQRSPKFSRSDQPGQKLSTPYRQLYFLYLVFVNAWLLIFPSSLRHDYRFGYVPLIESLADYRLALTAIFFASLLAFCLCVLTTVRRRRFHTAAGWALSLVALFFLPSSNLLFNVGFVVAERVLYLPSMGLCLLVGAGSCHLLNSNRPILRCLVKVGLAILVASHSVKTVHRSGVWNTGLGLFVEALKLYPRDALMFSNLAYEYENVNDTHLSEQLQLHAIKLGPKFVQPHRNYAFLLHKQKRYKEAEKMYRKAIELSGPTLRKYQNTPEIYKLLAEVIGTNESRYQQSLQVMETLIAIAPHLPMAHQEKARYLLKLNRTEEADLALQKVLRLYSGRDMALLEMGRVYLDEKRFEKAARCFREGMRYDPRNGYLMLELGVSIANNKTAVLQDLQQAIGYLKSVAMANSSLERVYFHLGVIYFRLQKLETAKDYFERTLELDSTHKDAAILLGYIHYTLKNYHHVVNSLSTISERDLFENGYYDMVTLLGNSYASLDRDKEAQELYYDVLQRDTENLSALNGLGALRAKQSRMSEALDYFKRVLRLDRANERALNYLKQFNMN